MSLWLLLATSLAGGFGAVCRFACDTYLFPRAKLPIAIMLVNLTGSFAIGIIVGISETFLPDTVATALSAGFLGGYTTFSTVSFQTVEFIRNSEWSRALFIGAGQLIAGIVLAILGLLVGSALL